LNEDKNTAQGEAQEGVDQAAEILIVGCADAVVQPLAMMVEFFAAPVARSAMLCVLLDISDANTAEEVHLRPGVLPDRSKRLLKMFKFSLLVNKHVCWNRRSAYVGIVGCEKSAGCE